MTFDGIASQVFVITTMWFWYRRAMHGWRGSAELRRRHAERAVPPSAADEFGLRRRPLSTLTSDFGDALKDLARGVQGGFAKWALGNRVAEEHEIADRVHDYRTMRPRPWRADAVDIVRDLRRE